MGRLAETHGGVCVCVRGSWDKASGKCCWPEPELSGMDGERWLAGETGSHRVHAGVSKDAINYVTHFLPSKGCIHLRNRCSPLNSTLSHSGSCSQLLPRATPAFLPTHYYDKTSPHIPMELCFALGKLVLKVKHMTFLCIPTKAFLISP